MEAVYDEFVQKSSHLTLQIQKLKAAPEKVLAGLPTDSLRDARRNIGAVTRRADARIYLELEVRRVLCRKCGKVKREALDRLADNPFYTKRFAYYVGRKCRAMTVKDVAKELKLDWHTVKALDKECMRKQLERNPIAAPRVIGIDEVSL